jgi:hypothetical protein
VVVLVGETLWVPLVAVELVQPLGVVAAQLVALVVDQVRVALWPELIDVGLALNVMPGAGVPDP